MQKLKAFIRLAFYAHITFLNGICAIFLDNEEIMGIQYVTKKIKNKREKRKILEAYLKRCKALEN